MIISFVSVFVNKKLMIPELFFEDITKGNMPPNIFKGINQSEFKYIGVLINIVLMCNFFFLNLVCFFNLV